MMTSSLPFLLLALSTVLAAPALDDDYTQVVVPQKRAALVLDRLLIALQKALREEGAPAQRYERPDRNGPRAAPLTVPVPVPGPSIDYNNMMGLSEDGGAPEAWRSLQDIGPRFAPLRLADLQDNTSALQRRTGTGRGRVLRCYFNAVTCF